MEKLPKGTLKNWVYAEKQGEFAAIGKHKICLFLFERMVC